jgi:NodT family efflux transporter outer membrane factor (OMF) lipoprotein
MKKFIPLIACLSLTACEVGPDYTKPDAPLSETYKEQPGWVAAAPALAEGDTPWWAIYKDPVLDGLEKQIDISNQTLKESEAAYRQSQAIVIQALAAFYPTVSLNGSASYSQSGGGGNRGVVSGPSATTTSPSQNTSSVTQGSTIVSGGTNHSYNIASGASWDLDVWGRIRRMVETQVANAQASAADLEAARLAAEGSLATDYFELRYEDQFIQLLDQTVKAYQQSLKITQNQYNAGVAAKTDVLNARTQLEAAQSQQINAGVARAAFEHAIAVLTGQPPASLTIPPAPLTDIVPVVPAGVPATLLQRRPDIAEAERKVEAASAAIGVSQAAYYPDVTLSASFGYVGPDLGKLIQSSNQDWSAGPGISETIFDGGLRGGILEQSRAAYDQAVASYRQTVLTALQAVEDDLAQQAIYTKQAEVENQTVKDAEEAVRLSLNQYKAGTIVFSNVIQAQAIALGDEETALQLRQNRLVATVSLIEALGGGWDASKLPTRDQVEDVPYGIFP